MRDALLWALKHKQNGDEGALIEALLSEIFDDEETKFVFTLDEDGWCRRGLEEAQLDRSCPFCQDRGTSKNPIVKFQDPERIVYHGCLQCLDQRIEDQPLTRFLLSALFSVTGTKTAFRR